MENFRKSFIAALAVSTITGSIFGGIAGYWAASSPRGFDLMDWFLGRPLEQETAVSEIGQKVITVEEESAVTSAVEQVSPAVVSIIVAKDLPIIEQYYGDPFGSDFFREFFGDGFGDFFRTPQYRQKGTEKREVGGGTGFIVSPDG